jgi:hypothetical protein
MHDYEAVEVRNIILISGKDSLATAIVQKTRRPGLDYEFIYNYTYADVPEIDDWLIKVENYLGQKILRIGEDLHDIIEEQGILPSLKRRFCTRLSKIFPLRDYLDGDFANVYYGLRADEERVGFDNSFSPNIKPLYPLRDVGFGITQVYELLGRLDLLPPTFFWESLYEEVITEINKEEGPDAHVKYITGLSQPQFNVLFAWRSRPNCYFCFYQSYYEWVGLLEIHPDLFEKALEMEENYGGEDFTWNSNKFSLRTIREQAARIKAKRVRKIIRTLKGLYNGTPLPVKRSGLDVTSCGLLCGK